MINALKYGVDLLLQNQSSAMETHEDGASYIEIDENTVAEDELSKNTVPNNHVQDFKVSPNTSLSVEESSINSHNVTDEDNPQVKSSREQIKEMLAILLADKRNAGKKIHRKTPVPESLFSPLAQVSSCEFCEISQNSFFTDHLWMTASK